jgi:hypothetical protein
MGTRSLTIVTDECDKEIAVMYRQFDGYPAGHGQELASFLAGMMLVNGLPLQMPKDTKIANGMECLAAQIVAHFKTKPGAIYLCAAGTRGVCEEYDYTVYTRSDGHIYVRVEEVYVDGAPSATLYDSTPRIGWAIEKYGDNLGHVDEGEEEI